MAKNLRKKTPSSIPMYVYDVYTPNMRKMSDWAAGAGGVFECTSASQVASKAASRFLLALDSNPSMTDLGHYTFPDCQACIITIDPEGKHVEQVFLDGTTGILSLGDISGKLFLDMSTIDPATASRCSAAVRERGGWLYDAPVSGGTHGAEAGTLTIMVGVSEADENWPVIHDVLGLMGTSLFACGGPTLGLAQKICNNYISGTIALATAEGMNLGMRLGLNPKIMSSILAVSTGGSWVNCECRV
jgi:3-hydroxyisobutyrate dehydrogenase